MLPSFLEIITIPPHRSVITSRRQERIDVFVKDSNQAMRLPLLYPRGSLFISDQERHWRSQIKVSTQLLLPMTLSDYTQKVNPTSI